MYIYAVIWAMRIRRLFVILANTGFSLLGKSKVVVRDFSDCWGGGGLVTSFSSRVTNFVSRVAQ